MTNNETGFGEFNTDDPIAPGKLPHGALERLLHLARKEDDRIILGPGIGEDAAVIKPLQRPLVIASDPITFRTPRPGYYAVHVNANDIAVTGGNPLFFTVTLIMPPGSVYRDCERIMKDAIEAANDLGITLAGGHSEVSESVKEPLISVTMIGELMTNKPLCTGNGRPGDAVIQVNPMAIEGTSIISVEHEEEIRKRFGNALYEKAANFIYEPGLSVLKPAQTAADNLPVHAMHDPTEGGIATGLLEIAKAGGTGLKIYKEKMIIADETDKICKALGYNPLGLISSGCLLFTVPFDKKDDAVNLMRKYHYQSDVIGVLTENAGRYLMRDSDGNIENLPEFDVDELA